MKRERGFPEIWAVVLAAGESIRMKSPKLVLPFNGRTIIEDVILNILGSGLKNIIVVTGAWKEELIEKISALPVDHCLNENYKQGMLSSVICGLNALPVEAEAAFIFQGDQPGIDPEVVGVMIEKLRRYEKGIIIPVHNRKRGHPLLIARKYFPEVIKLDPEIGLRDLMVQFPEDITEVNVGNEIILRDIDTKEDYLELINKLN